MSVSQLLDLLAPFGGVLVAVVVLVSGFAHAVWWFRSVVSSR